ncbi:MAG: hypothetical protein ACI9XJ_002254, partial [Marivirga sp.]
RNTEPSLGELFLLVDLHFNFLLLFRAVNALA